MDLSLLHTAKDIRLRRVLNRGEKLLCSIRLRQDQPPVVKPMLMDITRYLFLSNCSNKTLRKEHPLSSEKCFGSSALRLLTAKQSASLEHVKLLSMAG